MCSVASSAAIALISPMTPCLEAQYTANIGASVNPAADEVFAIRPHVGAELLQLLSRGRSFRRA